MTSTTTLTGLSRRRFIGATSGAAAAVTLVDLAAAPGAFAGTRAHGHGGKGGKSRNGWPVLSEAPSHVIEGSAQQVRLADGDAAVLLLHVARRFHYEIDSLRSGDVEGWTAHAHVTQPYESNYLSGSAMAIRPLCYPAGAKGNFYPNELVVIRDILSELDGAVAWGGDFTVPKESHFELALRPGHPRLKGVARKIQGWQTGPGNHGAGATDAFDPHRRKAARAFERRMAS
ncbi:hypothetical protein [Streptomyces beihaiensis]|uniref:M15 family peptidase n=1 Tax=Streptomyces beihaiensis TaxID=2984495 RepID=A0ABT3TTN9_9ACTN|nr:hypothetical protein [Streptomyces beihaiensis]MCX3060394.1 hypothetical protein [Streptomyces beihaiensis]